ncbi:MAG: DNA alkylation repair protein [Caldisericia bacterium]|nr:DNA alkylation repair protein [Caldisericia bacterium]
MEKHKGNKLTNIMIDEFLTVVRKTLKDQSDPIVENSTQRYFKKNINAYGIKSATVKKLAKEHYSTIQKASKEDIFNICEKLWQSGYLEETFIASNWSYRIRKQFKPIDFNVLESWVEKYIDNWASCDTFCNRTVGYFIEAYPEFISSLQKWAKSKNRWVRRASAVSLIVPAKKGKFLEDIFSLSDILLQDTDDMVRKGYGWLLKVSSTKHEEEVFNYVMKNKKVMPRTSLRYAIEKMPVNLKKLAMEK